MARAPKESSSEPASNKIAEARAKNLDLAIQQIQKDFGEGAIMRMGEDTHDGHRGHSDRQPAHRPGARRRRLPARAHRGGFRAGILGQDHAHADASSRRRRRPAGWPRSSTWSTRSIRSYARKLGVNLDDLLVSQPSSGEEALRICETLVRSNALDVIVLDSVAALVTRQELEGEIGDSTVGAQARLMSAAMRKLTALIAKARTCCIFTNQIREKIGVMFGNPETTPGGKALKFYASVRIDIRRIGAIKNADGTVTGNRTKVKIVKNKVAPPFTEAEFDIMYNEGISGVGSLLDLALEYDILAEARLVDQLQGHPARPGPRRLQRRAQGRSHALRGNRGDRQGHARGEGRHDWQTRRRRRGEVGVDRI